MLQMQGLHPFHYQRVHDLKPEDYPARMDFCNWILNNEEILPRILWCDESTFTRNGSFNMHNVHFWANENPRAVRRTNFQNRFSVNLWVGIVGNQIIGPSELPDRLNAANYLFFLQNQLEDLMDEVPLAIRAGMHFQHDGAPAHFGRAVRHWLDQNYPARWIGRGGPIVWPPRSPDLNPVDYYFWGRMKDIVYATEVETREDLLERINLAGNMIRQNNFEILRASQSIRRRARMCIEQNGNLIEHLPY